MPPDDTCEHELCKLEILFVSMLSEDWLPIKCGDVRAEHCATSQQDIPERAVALELGVGYCDHRAQACLKERLIDEPVEEVMHPGLVPHQAEDCPDPLVSVFLSHPLVVEKDDQILQESKQPDGDYEACPNEDDVAHVGQDVE